MLGRRWEEGSGAVEAWLGAQTIRGGARCVFGRPEASNAAGAPARSWGGCEELVLPAGAGLCWLSVVASASSLRSG